MPDGLEGGVGGRSQLGASQWRGANRERKKEKQTRPKSWRRKGAASISWCQDEGQSACFPSVKEVGKCV